MDGWRRADAVLWRDCVDRIILLAPAHDEPLVLAGTGAILWDLLADSPSDDGLIASLADLFDTDAEHIRDDVAAALNELATSGAVERCPA